MKKKPKPSLSRSEMMARIRRKDTQPELALRKALFALGLRYRVDFPVKGVGRVDIAFISSRIAVQVDGCFWHGCPVHCVMPRTRPGFWRAKIQTNRARDRSQDALLLKSGWCVLRIWEHQIEDDFQQTVEIVQAAFLGRT